MINVLIKKRTPLKLKKRLRNKARLRKKVFGTAKRPRLSVFKSSRHIYAQLIDDLSGQVLASADSLKIKESGSCKGAELVGKKIADQAKTKKIQKIVFDRNGFIYHGRIKHLAQQARKAGLTF